MLRVLLITLFVIAVFQRFSISISSFIHAYVRQISNNVCAYLVGAENTFFLSSLNRLSLKQGTGNRGTGEPGNRGTGEPGNRGTGEPGNRGTGEQGNRGTGEPGNRGTGEPGNGGTGERGNRGTGERGNRGMGEPENRGTGERGKCTLHTRKPYLPSHFRPMEILKSGDF